MSAPAVAPKHPAATPAQRRILDAIGCGDSSPIMTKRTRDAMLKAGLIEEVSKRVMPGALPLIIRQFQMPIPVHMAWCDYQSAVHDGAVK